MTGKIRIATRRAPARWILAGAVVALVVSGCTSAAEDQVADDSVSAAAAFVPPSYEKDSLVVNVAITDDGFDPSTVFIPAGRHIRLVVRNHGTGEHHLRVAGLIPAEMSWLLEPEIDAYDIDSLSPGELAALGITGDIDDLEHVLHHLTPSFVPYKEASPSGIKPLSNEVHGYVTPGKLEVMSFFATNPGAFVVEDVLHPEIIGRAVVFEETS